MKNKLDWNTRLKIASGAAQGLAYLHKDCTPQVVHRDVKSCNILLDADMEGHVADFGIAKNIQPARTHTSTHVLGTIGYIDPEYAQTSRLNDKSDVYSFGIVLLELLANKKAVDDEVNLLDWVRTTHSIFTIKPFKKKINYFTGELRLNFNPLTLITFCR